MQPSAHIPSQPSSVGNKQQNGRILIPSPSYANHPTFLICEHQCFSKRWRHKGTWMLSGDLLTDAELTQNPQWYVESKLIQPRQHHPFSTHSTHRHSCKRQPVAPPHNVVILQGSKKVYPVSHCVMNRHKLAPSPSPCFIKPISWGNLQNIQLVAQPHLQKIIQK